MTDLIIKGLTASEEDMSLINALAQSELKAEDVYIFKLRLCDNEVDRDYEAFTAACLKSLAEKFKNRTVINDHEPKSKNQVARIFKTEVNELEITASTGEPYTELIAYCYMPKAGNEKIISDIESGIKSECSVGCSVSKSICSICGAELHSGGCEHIKGKSYNGSLCFCKLDEPTDAYEVSFVAIPAQKNAHVIKSYSSDGSHTPNHEPETKSLMQKLQKLFNILQED